MSKKSKNNNIKLRCETVLLKRIFSDHDLIRYYNKYSNIQNFEDEENNYQDILKIMTKGLKGINSKYKYAIPPKSIKIYDLDHENSRLYLKKSKDFHKLTLFLCSMGSKPTDNIRYGKHVYDIDNGDFLLTGNGRLSINQLTRDCIVITTELHITGLNDKYIPRKTSYGVGVNIYEYKKDRERINFSDKNYYIKRAFMESEYIKYEQYKNYRKEVNRMKRIERELKKIQLREEKEERKIVDEAKISEKIKDGDKIKEKPETKKIILKEKETFIDIDTCERKENEENIEINIEKYQDFYNTALHPYLTPQEFEELFAPMHVMNIFSSL